MKDILRVLGSEGTKSEALVPALMESLCAETTPIEQKAFALGAAMAKGITAEFLAHAAHYLLNVATPLELDVQGAVDVCGTGGDSGTAGAKTFNISTAVAFVLAGQGVFVVKHGNKAVSGPSGSSDVLEALGVVLCTTSEEAKGCFKKHGLCFLSAPHFHPVLKNVAPLRRALGVPTFFNVLGPLVNPARVMRQLIGVYDAEMAEKIALAAGMLGKEKIMVVGSEDGLDELSPCAPTRLVRLESGVLTRDVVDPKALGLAPSCLKDIAGGSAVENARLIVRVFSGQETGPALDAIALNAGAAFVVAGVDKDLACGLARARDVVRSGKAQEKLESLKKSGV